MAATRNGHYATVDILLERGANSDMQTKVSIFEIFRSEAGAQTIPPRRKV